MSKDKSHHNTTNESGEQLEMFENKANVQEDIVIALYKRNPRMSAYECFGMFPQVDVPITSIRRAITNLTIRGKLKKTSDKRTGRYGRPEYIYEIVL